jgi:hypothetical protein
MRSDQSVWFNPMKRLRPPAIISAWLALLLAPTPVALAADTPSTSGGTIEGRVSNSVNGAYLNNARITLEGTNREVQTDRFGEFRFDRVPAGPIGRSSARCPSRTAQS